MTTTATKERPIIFSAPMVRAILNGSKTQSRRVMKPQPLSAGPGVCPHGRIGDRLWVRETWNTVNPEGEPTSILYKSDGALMYRPFPSAEAGWKAEQDAEAIDAQRWNTPIFMPRWASRITLEVTDVRVERVQEISQEDIVSEGVDGTHASWGLGSDHSVTKCFAELWDSINAKRGYSWESNPWVWAITFRKLEDGR
jgi:hypothetical protein